MSIGKIVRHFEGIGKVPVDPNDVLAEVRGLVGDILTIKVRGVEVDPDRLRGNCYRYQVDDSGVLLPKQIAMVVYNKRLHPFEQRLVFVKELAHLLDPTPIHTSKKEQVIYLAEELIKSPTPVGKVALNDLQVFYDLLAKWHALAILFPFGLWEELMPKAEAKTLDLEKLSEAVELPKEYVEFLMTKAWRTMRETILAYC